MLEDASKATTYFRANHETALTSLTVFVSLTRLRNYYGVGEVQLLYRKDQKTCTHHSPATSEDDDDYDRRHQEIMLPTDITEVRSFLELFNVFRCLGLNLARIAVPLNKLFMKDLPAAIGTLAREDLNFIDELDENWRHHQFSHHRTLGQSKHCKPLHATCI